MPYTVVQHSAFPKNPQFEQGLESAYISDGKIRKVLNAGGLVFSSYMAAEDYAEAEMYPKEYGGLIPSARGTFSTKTIDRRRIYIPPKKEK